MFNNIPLTSHLCGLPQEFSFVYNLLVTCQVVFKLYTEHVWATATRWSKYFNDYTNKMDIVDNRDLSLKRIPKRYCIATAPRFYLFFSDKVIWWILYKDRRNNSIFMYQFISIFDLIMPQDKL